MPEPDTTPVAHYLRKPIEVHAIQWHGETNCEAVFAFIGWEHPDDELDHSVIYLDDDQEAHPGDWIVRDPEGGYHAINPDRFADLYEPAPTPPATGNPAYDAVYAYIRRLGDYLPPDPVHRNAIIWRAVQAALDAAPPAS
jgi:hypothetical protein